MSRESESNSTDMNLVENARSRRRVQYLLALRAVANGLF